LLFPSYEHESFEKLGTYKHISGNHNGVAVDKDHFYAINDTSISKHNIVTGDVITQTSFENHSRIKHLNSGVVHADRIYVCNNPNDFNTIEVFNTNLEHKYTIDIAGNCGSLKAIDYYKSRWWGCFVHTEHDGVNTIIAEMYSPSPDLHATDKIHKWTIRNRFHFPDDARKDMCSNNVSGFTFGPRGLVYATVDTTNSLYVMHMSYNTQTMTLDEIISLDGVDGKSIVWDRKRKLLFGVNNEKGDIVLFEGMDN
jgi:hypothetical protein